jgi:hypothetical protein
MRSNKRLLETVLSFCPLRCSFCVPVHRRYEGKISASRLLFCFCYVWRGGRKKPSLIAVVARSVCHDLEPVKSVRKSHLLDRIERCSILRTGSFSKRIKNTKRGCFFRTTVLQKQCSGFFFFFFFGYFFGRYFLRPEISAGFSSGRHVGHFGGAERGGKLCASRTAGCRRRAPSSRG